MLNNPNWLIPNWPVPPWIKAFTTLRQGGVSQKPFDTFNLASHVGDDPNAVKQNRAILKQTGNLPSDPIWITQVHGCRVLDLDQLKSVEPAPLSSLVTNYTADASICSQPNQVCAVLTADCLPILLCNLKGSQISTIHAGWRGLAQGIVEATVKALACEPHTLMAWLGPAIGPNAFEVGLDVKRAFTESDSAIPGSETAFKPCSSEKWMCNLYQLATLRLNRLGITQIYGGGYCCYTDYKRFFSFRRSNTTGRMATLIWIDREK